MTSRLCNRLILVDSECRQHRCSGKSGHDGGHSAVLKLKIDEFFVVVSCLSCRMIYYRSDLISDHRYCVRCSGKLEVLGERMKLA